MVVADQAQEEQQKSGRLPLFSKRQTKYFHFVVYISIFVLAAVCNFYNLGKPSIWFDEAFSVEFSRQPLPLFVHGLLHREPNMQFYYIILHFWLELVGIFGFTQTELIVRFPSAISATFSAIVIYALGRRYIGTWVGILAAILFIVNALQLTYAQQTRSYALEILLNCISWFALLKVIHGNKRFHVWHFCYIITAALSVYTHLLSFFILFAQALTVAGLLILPNAWQKQIRKQLLWIFLTFAAMGLLCIPMFLLSRIGGTTAGWLASPKFIDIYKLLMAVAGNKKMYLLGFGACIAIGTVLVGLSYCLQYMPRLKERLAKQFQSTNKLFSQQDYLPLLWLLLCWFIVPIIISFVISQGPNRVFSSRYLVVILPPIFLLVGLGIYTLRNRGVQVLLALQLIFLAVSTVPMYYRSAQVEDWNSTSAWLMQRYEKDDGLVCYDNGQGCQISFEYYLHAYPQSGAYFSSDSPGSFSWEKYYVGNADKALDKKALKTYASTHKHIFFITARLSSDEMVKKVEETHSWLDSNYQFVEQIKTRTVTIRLYKTDR